ncbi:MAG: response regulator [Planctomycetota bacterium]
MNILLLHSDEAVNEYFSLRFCLSGHMCRTMGQGTTHTSFREELKFRCPDVVILDPAFKPLNALRLCQELDQEANRPVCLFLGDMKEPEEVLDAYMAGADVCLPKGADLEDIMQAIKETRQPGLQRERCRSIK